MGTDESVHRNGASVYTFIEPSVAYCGVERSMGWLAQSAPDAHPNSVSGMCRVEIGCARNVPGIGWFGAGQALQVID